MPEPARARPASCGELFRVCTRLAMQGFGGVLPVAQRELVERAGWLTKQEFLEMLAVAQVLPGPNIINLGLMIGDRFFGWRGALAAVGGMMLLPLVLVLTLAALAAQAGGLPWVGGALRGMAVVAAGLIVATALKLMAALRSNPLGPPLSGGFVAASLLAVGLLRWPLVWVVLGLGSVAIAMAWWRLGRLARAAAEGRRADGG